MAVSAVIRRVSSALAIFMLVAGLAWFGASNWSHMASASKMSPSVLRAVQQRSHGTSSQLSTTVPHGTLRVWVYLRHGSRLSCYRGGAQRLSVSAFSAAIRALTPRGLARRREEAHARGDYERLLALSAREREQLALGFGHELECAHNDVAASSHDTNNRNSGAKTPHDLAHIPSQSLCAYELHHGLIATWDDVPLCDAHVNAVLDALELPHSSVRARSKWLHAVSVDVPSTHIALLHNVAALPHVQMVDIVRRVGHTGKIDDTPQRIAQSSSLSYGSSFSQLSQIRVTEAHSAGFNGTGATLMVIDTGFNTAHPGIRPSDIHIEKEWDFLRNDSNTANEGGDYGSQHYHGTAVLSLAGGYENGVCIGAAFGATFLLAKTEDVGSESQVEEDYFVSAVEWGDANGADVISSSLGYIDWYTQADLNGNIAPVTIAANTAVEKGIVFAQAAGNSGPNGPSLIAPADAKRALVVGAVTSSGGIASFSSRGPTADGRTKPDVCARGYLNYIASANGGYTTGSGTSYATPLVAGAAAIMKGRNRTLTGAQISDALRLTASRASSPDNTYGYGIIDIMQAMEDASSVPPAGDPNVGLSNAAFSVQASSLSTVVLCAAIAVLFSRSRFAGA